MFLLIDCMMIDVDWIVLFPFFNIRSFRRGEVALSKIFTKVSSCTGSLVEHAAQNSWHVTCGAVWMERVWWGRAGIKSLGLQLLVEKVVGVSLAGLTTF